MKPGRLDLLVLSASLSWCLISEALSVPAQVSQRESREVPEIRQVCAHLDARFEKLEAILLRQCRSVRMAPDNPN